MSRPMNPFPLRSDFLRATTSNRPPGPWLPRDRTRAVTRYRPGDTVSGPTGATARDTGPSCRMPPSSGR